MNNHILHKHLKVSLTTYTLSPFSDSADYKRELEKSGKDCVILATPKYEMVYVLTDNTDEIVLFRIPC